MLFKFKKFILLVLLPLVLVNVVLLSLFLGKGNRGQPPKTSENQVQYQVKSSLPGVSLDLKDKEVFLAALVANGSISEKINQGELYQFGEREAVKAKRVVIELTDQKQRFLKNSTVDKNGRPVEFLNFGSSFDPAKQEYTLKIYTDLKFLKSLYQEKEIEKALTVFVIQGLYEVTHLDLVNSDYLYSLERYITQLPALPLSLHYSLFYNFPLVRTVYADTCEGHGIGCGDKFMAWRCSVGGAACTSGSKCNGTGTCQYKEVCEGNETVKSCDSSCVSTGCSVGQCKNADDTCHWNGNGGGALPTPTPGGGGSCEVPTQCGSPPGCYSPNCDDCNAAGLSCTQATCGGGTCATPTPTPSPTPIPVSGFIQGRRVAFPTPIQSLITYISDYSNNPIPLQTVSMFPVSGTYSSLVYPADTNTTYRNRYGFSPVIFDKDYTVSVTAPAGYAVYYSICYNQDASTGCHSDLKAVAGTSVTIEKARIEENFNAAVFPTHYVDLWWHFQPFEGIQGRIVKPDGSYVNPSDGFTPYLDGTVAAGSAENSGKYYYFSISSYGDHQVSFSPPAPYSVSSYQLCYNNPNTYNCSYGNTGTVSISQSSLLNDNYNWSEDKSHYADLWFWLSTPTPTPTPTLTPCPVLSYPANLRCDIPNNMIYGDAVSGADHYS